MLSEATIESMFFRLVAGAILTAGVVYLRYRSGAVRERRYKAVR